ncbi:hypothetical protein J437_LFUL011535 [Ladona fulva]|uniref:RING-type domain-containing protein n=1 Tax=Ladona fulva TaxID=123851 RepID=A0A8K0KDS9_LADFU|nr:hypothetical protein J437_LFUL011535 [Ladona fulva]
MRKNKGFSPSSPKRYSDFTEDFTGEHHFSTMGRKKKSWKRKSSFCTTKKTLPKAERKQPESKSVSNSTETRKLAVVRKKAIVKCQDSEKSVEDSIETLEEENKSLHECIKTQEDTIKEMGNERNSLLDRFDSVNKELEELKKVNEKQREYETIHEEIIETIIKETDKKDDSEVSLKEAINSLVEEYSTLRDSEWRLQETIKIILDDLERLQCTEEYLKETIKKQEEEKERAKESLMCIVCLQREFKVVFVPCGHLITCSDCSAQVNQCPLCRQSISSRLDVFRQ